MKTKLKFGHLKRAAALLALSTTMYQTSARAQGTAFTYQGRLNDGSNPAGGTYDLRFSLYDSLGGGSQVGGVLTNAATSVSNGLFTVVLDFGNQFPGASRWLEIGVRTNSGGAFVTLSPRQQLTPTPYAITAENVLGGGLASGTYSNAVTFNNAGDSFSGSFSGNGAGLTNLSLGAFAGAGFWKTNGNSGADPANGAFVGTSDNLPLEIKVNGLRALRLEPTTNSNNPNLIGGYSGNVVSNGFYGAVIAGGGAPGSPNRIGGYYATILGGTANTASGDYAVAAGTSSTASGNEATAMGGSTTASGPAATALGLFSTASGTGSTALGGVTKATNSYATALGFAAIAGGPYSTAAGHSSLATGDSSVGMGYITTASGAGAIALGYGANSSGGASVALGYYTTASGNSSTATGAGTIANNTYATAMGSSTVASGTSSTALGNGTSASGVSSTAMGEGTSASGDYSTALGYHSAATGGSAVAMGYYCNAYLVGSTAMGYNCTAGHYYATAMGYNAQANNLGSFVWSDNSITSGASSAVDNSVTMRAVGGYRLFSNTGSSAGVFLAGNANAWGSISDRNSKKNIVTVNYQEILERLVKVPVAQWNYKWEKDNDVPNLGPMAQDFKAAFYPGRDDKSITTLEFDGVELAAIQGLNQKLSEQEAALKNKDSEIQELRQAVMELQKTVRKITNKTQE
jgi:trimeric autotransporter adhesin